MRAMMLVTVTGLCLVGVSGCVAGPYGTSDYRAAPASTTTTTVVRDGYGNPISTTQAVRDANGNPMSLASPGAYQYVPGHYQSSPGYPAQP
jgi:hypothetical protein